MRDDIPSLSAWIKKLRTSIEVLNFLEVAIGFEPMNQGVADPRLTTWLCRQINIDVHRKNELTREFFQTNLRFGLTPRVGLEPTTLRLTAECSTIELSRKI